MVLKSWLSCLLWANTYTSFQRCSFTLSNGTIKLNGAMTYFVWAGSGVALSGLYHMNGKARLNAANGGQCYWSQRHRDPNPALRSFTKLKARHTEAPSHCSTVKIFGLMLKWYDRKTLLLMVRVSCRVSHTRRKAEPLALLDLLAWQGAETT